MAKERHYSNAGRGTRPWWHLISEAVKEGNRARAKLEALGYRFESAGGGLIAFRVTCPDGTVIPKAGVDDLVRLLAQAEAVMQGR